MQPYDIYELMMIPPNTKVEMIVDELRKPEPNLDLVRDLITLGANLDWLDESGWTALHWCSYSNNLEIAKMFIDAGADLNIQDNHDMTPLHWCAYRNHPGIAKILLDAGADKIVIKGSYMIPYNYRVSKEILKVLTVWTSTTFTNS
jgi:ankyrin repeat protein